MPEVKSGSVRISYDAVGEGRPLVLLHGWCSDPSPATCSRSPTPKVWIGYVTIGAPIAAFFTKMVVPAWRTSCCSSNEL